MSGNVNTHCHVNVLHSLIEDFEREKRNRLRPGMKEIVYLKSIIAK